ncbi:hypothetical protein BHE74_00011220 [Ensete ventricosum]|uniref:Uncharacterized protein n=1 Tax=Ensete ventricosum TaxID=4639 RepID=A0A444E4V5_ENSVE|nr:hypothetical protein B296_00006427 [Ensete ventricosum]RWW05412.1 hypothetical protein GW17_00031311 [Ensete ventricosum]RWW80438.1 hypothetical protein BHE74_00011220 [Ensete ventricosum]RZR70538.1 hypothetical protein BHM03_00000390 [Ensete ventricosum]
MVAGRCRTLQIESHVLLVRGIRTYTLISPYIQSLPHLYKQRHTHRLSTLVLSGAQKGSTMDYPQHHLRKQRSCACPPLHVGSWCNSRCATADFNRTFADDYDDELDPLNYRPAQSRLRGLWRRIVRGKRRVSISSPNPMRVSYDPYTYAQNFDEGSASVEPDNLWRSFSARFAAPSRTTRRVG